MSVRLACADFTFPLLEHERSLDLIAMLGFDGVDVGMFEGRSHLQPSREFAQAEAGGRRLARQLDERGLACADLFLQADPDFHRYPINHSEPSRRDHARELFVQALDFATAAAAQHLTVLPGVLEPGVPESDCWRRCADELAWRAERCRERGIAFGTEAHVGSIAPDPRAALRLARCAEGCGLTLDYTHFTRAGYPDREIEPLIAYANHFHLLGACRGRLQVGFDANVIDYGAVLDRMAAVGYAGYVGIEYVWTAWERCNEVDNLSETIRYRDFVRGRRPAAGIAG